MISPQQSPNSITKTTEALFTNANGNSSSVTVFQIKGNNTRTHKFPLKIHIQASVHGAEVQGNAVIWQLLHFFQHYPLEGQMSLVPMANPLGITNHQGGNTQGRFDSITGENWNRQYIDVIALSKEQTHFSIKEFVQKLKEHKNKLSNHEIKELFKTEIFKALCFYQKKINERGPNGLKVMPIFYQKLAAVSDIVLDLHTGPCACDYLYVATPMKDRSLNMLWPYTLLIPEEFAGAMDEACFMPWAYLERECHSQGVAFENDFDAFTVELGSEEFIHLKKAKLQAARILHYLSSKGALSKEHLDEWLSKEEEAKENLKPPHQYTCLLSDYKRYFAPTGGLVDYLLKPGMAYEKGALIAQVYNFNSWPLAPVPIMASASGIVINHHTSSSVREGTTLYQVMENQSVTSI